MIDSETAAARAAAVGEPAIALSSPLRTRFRRVERALQHEVMLRLGIAERAGRLHAVFFAVPNGVFLPARTAVERELAARLVRQMKERGQLTPGVADLVFCWASGAGALELKRPAAYTLLDRIPAGRLSVAQRAFRDRCQAQGVRWAQASSWPEVEDVLSGWGILDGR